MGTFFQDRLCFAVIGIVLIICVAVMVKVLRDRRRRPRKRNSLQQYPSFVANRITGVFTILPPGQLYKDSRRLSEQYIIAIAPPIDFYDSSLGFYERLYPYPGRAVRLRRESDTSEFEFDLNNNHHFPMEQQVEYEEEDENNNFITMRIHSKQNDA